MKREKKEIPPSEFFPDGLGPVPYGVKTQDERDFVERTRREEREEIRKRCEALDKMKLPDGCENVDGEVFIMCPVHNGEIDGLRDTSITAKFSVTRGNCSLCLNDRVESVVAEGIRRIWELLNSWPMYSQKQKNAAARRAWQIANRLDEDFTGASLEYDLNNEIFESDQKAIGFRGEEITLNDEEESRGHKSRDLTFASGLVGSMRACDEHIKMMGRALVDAGVLTEDQLDQK